jgi:hypothetical protein
MFHQSLNARDRKVAEIVAVVLVVAVDTVVAIAVAAAKN